MPKAVFIEIDDEGYYCGNLNDPDLHNGIGHVIKAHLVLGRMEFTTYVTDMTEEEISRLPS